MARRPSKYKGYLFETDTDVPRTTQFKRKHLNADVEEIPDEPNEEIINPQKHTTFSVKGFQEDLNEECAAIPMEIEKLDDLPHQEIVHVENEFQQALLESQEDYQHLTTETYYDAFSEYVDNEEEHLNISRISFENSNIQLQEMEEFLYNSEYFDDAAACMEASGEEASHFQKLQNVINNEDFYQVLSTAVNKTKGELLMMILKFCIIFSLSQTAVVSLFQLINSLFEFPILPATRYLIDTLFNPSKNATFHGMCPNCGIYLGTFERNQKCLKCNLCNDNIDVKNSSYDDFFVYFDVSLQISELISQNSDYYNHIMNDRVHNPNIMEDIYDGRLYQKFLNGLSPSDRHQYCTLVFNTDGAPLYESSTYSIWPIFLQVNEVPLQIRTTELIVAGLWFGKSKPDMNVFLDPFVKNMNKLSQEGIPCNINNKKLMIKVFPIVCC
ncbi:uncharacterized protein LOC127285680 [Leptopilina boulardi]|uniref:uncharacterized protein LOC127285680 n=1 Tax=Leptopilina boulardi TaxID=63433 RepID=UPI0021F5CE2D|nr:uncharacterized protein LOC127285680 [Leptopilina boulardi]